MAGQRRAITAWIAPVQVCATAFGFLLGDTDGSVWLIWRRWCASRIGGRARRRRIGNPRPRRLHMYEIELVGIDGANLLGYLAAIGTLRVLTLAEPRAGVRMRWAEKEWWTPVVCHSRIATQDELIGALAQRVCGRSSIDRKST